ncbi:MAG: NtaA/DmoA family FMN-dependent monooxygenase [Gammaproteobacteria bacterium]|nr:NtaA/DmoA family FMN-dependent monooxygenase [Gammaproteobacteria bacterium]MCP5200918.1 NtaA/DmoA family FMN-dependent monooxygenase [Gammaproteobacteria bacterium]
MASPLLFSAFVMNTASHILHGLWRQPDARQVDFNSLEMWIDLVRELERGLFDVIFFADVHGLYGNFQGSFRKHVESGLQIPSNDPAVILSALASHTEHLGLAFTSSIVQEHPFAFARKLSTLDHASRGRVAWNIVTNGIENGARNFGLDGLTPHDERYAWADEYMEVVYKLWEGSWDDGALLQDRARGLHADFARVHRIDHVGPRYRVEGPHLCAPSPQRTPLLFQAGSSPRGMRFAATHAEAVFLIAPFPDAARQAIEATRALLPQCGRRPDELRFFQGLSFVIGSTEEEARRRDRELDEAIDHEAMIAHLGGVMDIEFGACPLDMPLTEVRTEGAQSLLDWVRAAVRDREATVRDIGVLASRASRVSGTPEQIADSLEAWQAVGIDGINVINATIPGSYREFIEHVLPVLRRRGLAREAYGDGTLRQRLFGHDRLPASHPAARWRGAFAD